MPFDNWADLIKLVVTATSVLMLIVVHVCQQQQQQRRRRRQPLEAPKPKNLTFHIDDIPIDDTEKLVDNILSVVEQDPDLQEAVATMVHRSSAPMGKHFVCATFSITTPLSGDDLCTHLRQSGKAYPYKYTCKFYGLTPLYDNGNGADVEYVLLVFQSSTTSLALVDPLPVQRHRSAWSREPRSWFLEKPKRR